MMSGEDNDMKIASSTSQERSWKAGLFRKGGVIPSAVCLSKAAIGAGVLSMATHSAEVGIIYQMVGLAVGAWLTLVSINMIAKASIATGCWSYEDICEELFHPGMSLMTGFVNVCNCVGSGAGYLIVCGQVFQVLSGANRHWRNVFVLLMGVFVCAPLALARQVSFMRHLAAWSVGFLLTLVLVVIVSYAENGPDETITPKILWFGPGSTNVFGYMNSLNNIVFAYNNQFNVPQLTGELTPQPTVARMSKVASITVTLCFGLFASVSIVGVLAFGVGARQRDSLVLDLAPERRNPLVIVALLGVMFSVLTCLQFHIYPIRQFFAYFIRKLRARSLEEPDRIVCGRTLTRWFDIFTALSSVTTIILIALVVTSIKTILDFVGAFAAAWIAFVVPPLWVLQLLRKQKDFSWARCDPLSCVALFALGIFFFAFGTYSAVNDALDGG